MLPGPSNEHFECHFFCHCVRMRNNIFQCIALKMILSYQVKFNVSDLFQFSSSTNMSGKEDDTRVRIQGEFVDGDGGGAGGCIEGLLWVLSVFLCCITFPFSLFVILKQVQVRVKMSNLQCGKVSLSGCLGIRESCDLQARKGQEGRCHGPGSVHHPPLHR